MAGKESKDLNKEAEQLLIQYEYQKQQLGNIMMQKQTLLMQQAEIESALKEVETAKELFKIVGPIIVKKSPEEMKVELDDKKEEIDLMLKTMERNEKKLREMLEKGEEKIKELLPSLQAMQPQHNHKCEGCGE